MRCMNWMARAMIEKTITQEIRWASRDAQEAADTKPAPQKDYKEKQTQR